MKARVPLWNTPQKFVTVDTDATAGATLGVNLFNPDGTLVTLAQFSGLAPFTMRGQMSVLVQGQPARGNVAVSLVNDQDNPGPLRYYRTDPTSAKGWSRILPGEVPTDLATYFTDPDGNYFTFPDSSFVTADQPDALVTDMLWESSDGFLRVFPAGASGQTLVAYDSKVVNVYRLEDFPAAVSAVITLAADTSYYVTTNLDLLGARLQCGANVGLFGDSASNCSLTSTGLGASTPLITSTSALNMEGLTIKDVGTALDLNDATSQLNWENIVFQNVPTVGTIRNYANIVWGQCILDNSANLTIMGTQGSLAFFECLFDGRPGQTTLIVPSSAIITRRIRMLYCAVICLPGETAFDVSTSATLPDEGYILDNVSFAGGGTMLAGIDYTSNKAAFFRCSGINNSASLGSYFMTGNATTTTIGATNTFVKVAGTTTAGSFNQKFTTATTQRLTYAGAQTALFRAVAFASMTSGNNQTLSMRIAKNGTTLAESNTLFKTTGSGEASAVGCQTLVQLAPGDYLEVFVANGTAATNITVSDLNMTVVRQD